ncbi:hypothetical protein [Fluviicola sp.]|uniref:hypothetical protein n=1 Tax=Fluviicola sp. TaxID=1917219 RepID=UPI0031E3CD12
MSDEINEVNSSAGNEVENLKNEINQFIQWLFDKKIIQKSFYIEHTFDFPSDDKDSMMEVNIDKRRVSFNMHILQCGKCSFDYFRIVVLHEFFHLAVQKVPNKDDATKIKDDFGSELMKLIDIEADFYVALYLKEKKGYTLVKYWEIYYEGGTVFADKWIRAAKFERFMGSLLSISKMFIIYPEEETNFTACDLYLPTISPIYTEDSLHILVIRKEHIYFDEIVANYQDFAKLKECYKDVTNYSVKGYVKNLLEFSSKALKMEIPKDVRDEIDELKK